MKQIREAGAASPEDLAALTTAAEPVVIRGLASHWPVAEAGRRGHGALFDYLSGFDAGQSVATVFAPAEAGGRFFYGDDLKTLNFRGGRASLRKTFDFLAQHAESDEQAALAAQSVPAWNALPGFAEANPLPLLGPEIEPRVWIGNRVIVAAHNDPYENIACVAAGRRRFTLFPPDQVANLYVGPFEHTPAGATISLVEFENPDLERFPRFAQALETAQTAELEPGDAIYVPYLWWHHVRSLDAVNMLVNYWWTPPAPGRGLARDAFLHAILALRALPPAHRAAWKALLDHYVFGDENDASAHLPIEAQGILGDLDETAGREVLTALSRALAEAAAAKRS
ncbi:cupin-like domain-containing protein [Caulobacter hibisci]|uniref:cupin-like domain-containing protein n=1 Tax=Caulobacter hibisci TaxID=2035993 RepID=UPI002FCDB608